MSTEIRGTAHFIQQENIRLKSENDRLQQEVVRLRLILRNLGNLNQMALSIHPETDILVLLDQILQAALDSIQATDGSLLLVDEDTKELSFVVVHGSVRTQLVGHRIPLGTGIAGWVAQNAESVIVPNVQTDPRFSPRVDQAFHFKTSSLVCVPIVFTGRVLGVIQAVNKSNRKEFVHADLLMLNVVAQLAAAAIARAESILLGDE
ncbi:MAG: GAF domain-containing protein [Ardenticatenaceae bacterium]|nr:GAF domain-containing protein [Anaerolineales bacterium]MCB8941981.1 GAF domain-containing protein [Ardenticatenaceae bacterium]MCB8973094.1 GAF domain-containing protein [Ardenticatenaceae bacterium]